MRSLGWARWMSVQGEGSVGEGGEGGEIGRTETHVGVALQPSFMLPTFHPTTTKHHFLPRLHTKDHGKRGAFLLGVVCFVPRFFLGDFFGIFLFRFVVFWMSSPSSFLLALMTPWLTSSPTTYSGVPSIRGGPNGGNNKLSNLLRSRTRVTNLAMLLLLSILSFSLLTNLQHWLHSVDSPIWQKESDGLASRLGTGLRTFKSIEDTIPKMDDELSELDHLIVVAGHAIVCPFPSFHLAPNA